MLLFRVFIFSSSFFFFSFSFYCVPCVRFHNKYIYIIGHFRDDFTGHKGTSLRTSTEIQTHNRLFSEPLKTHQSQILSETLTEQDNIYNCTRYSTLCESHFLGHSVDKLEPYLTIIGDLSMRLRKLNVYCQINDFKCQYTTRPTFIFTLLPGQTGRLRNNVLNLSTHQSVNEHNILKTAEPISVPEWLRGKGMKLSTLGVRKSNKVT